MHLCEKISGIFLAFQKLFFRKGVLKKGDRANNKKEVTKILCEDKNSHINILKEIEQVKVLLEQANIEFNSQINSDLIESCIYNIESLETRYNYLIKEARKLNIRQDARVICVTG